MPVPCLQNRKSPLSCLLVIPCYKDGHRLSPFLKSLRQLLPSNFAIQVVDDGSGKDHAKLLHQIILELDHHQPHFGAQILPPIFLPQNQGKGAAVRAGWGGCAKYDISAFVDADGSISAQEVFRGFHYLTDHWSEIDGVLGSRIRMLGKKVERNPFRHISGRIFATAVSLLCKLPVYDSQCGFKLFKSNFLAQIRDQAESNRFAFDVELILLLELAGARLHEIPIDWADQAGSKVRFSRDIPAMLFDVWKTSRRIDSGKNSLRL